MAWPVLGILAGALAAAVVLFILRRRRPTRGFEVRPVEPDDDRLTPRRPQ
jgi:hypothetical protein